MDSGTVSGIITGVLLVIFVGIVFWAYSGRRKKDFDEAARLPVDAERRDEKDRRNGQ
ncbi:cbb3-type cytochrome oxidase subunit 3 [Arhodomonas sp. SL1]|uniref:cbb3-type cytochrome oxidase subunit 3 n=1 Tax=Arhodomonas sp. SL1 TaxID=3425691 RepID=UPI003F881544